MQKVFKIKKNCEDKLQVLKNVNKKSYYFERNNNNNK